MSNDTIELLYFDGPGRAELIRLQLHGNGISFTDRRLTFEEFGAMKADPDSPVSQMYGSVPILSVTKDGKVTRFAQSQAICFYVNALAGLGGSAEDQALDLMITGTHADLQSACYKCLFGDDESKEKGKEALPATAAKFLAALERQAPAEGKFFRGGDKPTLADYAVFDIVTSKFPGLVALGIDMKPYPKINALVEAVKGFAGLAEYLKTRGF